MDPNTIFYLGTERTAMNSLVLFLPVPQSRLGLRHALRGSHCRHARDLSGVSTLDSARVLEERGFAAVQQLVNFREARCYRSRSTTIFRLPESKKQITKPNPTSTWYKIRTAGFLVETSGKKENYYQNSQFQPVPVQLSRRLPRTCARPTRLLRRN